MFEILEAKVFSFTFFVANFRCRSSIFLQVTNKVKNAHKNVDGYIKVYLLLIWLSWDNDG